MATQQKTPNPLFQKMRSDGVLSGDFGRLGVESTFANLRAGTGEQTDFGAINAAANQPPPDAGLFAALQPPSLANLGIHPSGGPTTSYAPTGFRDRVIQANGGLVYGQGNVMGATDGKNAAGGNRFFLGQVTPMGANGEPPAPPPNPIIGETAAQANPSMGSPFNQPTNSIFHQQQPGLGAYIPRGNPEQIKAQLAVIEPIQKMQREAQERAAIAAAHAPGVKDGLGTYLASGGRDIGVIDSFKKNALAERNLNMKQTAADTKAADAAKAEQEKAAHVTETSNTVIGTIDQILPKINWNTVGPVGSMKSHVAGTDAYDLAKLRDTVKSNVGLAQLQQMRDASKTGASGFGQLSEKELDVLQSSIASLDQAQKPEQFRQALTKVRDHFSAWKMSYEAGQKAASGTLTPQEQARAILAIRNASKGK